MEAPRNLSPLSGPDPAEQRLREALARAAGVDVADMRLQTEQAKLPDSTQRTLATVDETGTPQPELLGDGQPSYGLEQVDPGEVSATLAPGASPAQAEVVQELPSEAGPVMEMDEVDWNAVRGPRLTTLTQGQQATTQTDYTATEDSSASMTASETGNTVPVRGPQVHTQRSQTTTTSSRSSSGFVGSATRWAIVGGIVGGGVMGAGAIGFPLFFG